MNEYWEITHERAVATQAVWGMQPAFELNNLTRTQHGTLTDSLPTLAQTRDNKENDLTEALAAKHDVFAKVENLAIRVPGLIDGLLDDDDDLKEQLDAIYGIDPAASENAALRRARQILPLWTDVDAARAAAGRARTGIDGPSPPEQRSQARLASVERRVHGDRVQPVPQLEMGRSLPLAGVPLRPSLRGAEPDSNQDHVCH